MEIANIQSYKKRLEIRQRHKHQMLEPHMAIQNIEEVRFQYAWNWFEFHAKQRTTMFNYFLVSVGIFANAAVLAIRFTNSHVIPAAILFAAALYVLRFGT